MSGNSKISDRRTSEASDPVGNPDSTRPLMLEGLLIAALVMLGVVGRLLPHPPNFTPVAAAALFGGFLIRDWRLALLVPLIIMFISDRFHTIYQPEILVVVYGSLCLPVVLRRFLRSRLTPFRVAGCALASSLLFYLLTNFAFWWFSPFYSHDLPGLLACYVAGLPFLKYTLAGDLFWSSGLFGAYALGCSVMETSRGSLARPLS